MRRDGAKNYSRLTASQVPQMSVSKLASASKLARASPSS